MEKLRVEIGSFIDFVRAEYGDSARIERPLVIAVNKWDMSPYFRSAEKTKRPAPMCESVGIYRDIYKSCKAIFRILSSCRFRPTAIPRKTASQARKVLTPTGWKSQLPSLSTSAFPRSKRKLAIWKPPATGQGLPGCFCARAALWRRCPAFDYGPLLQKPWIIAMPPWPQGVCRRAQCYRI